MRALKFSLIMIALFTVLTGIFWFAVISGIEHVLGDLIGGFT